MQQKQSPDEIPLGPDMRDLMAAIGELLLYWGFLETAIHARLNELCKEDATQSKAPLIARWQKAEELANPDDFSLHEVVKQIQAVAAIRNSLAHGLSSASANPYGTEEPRVVCITDAGSDTFLLSDLTRQVSRSTMPECGSRTGDLISTTRPT